MGAVQRLATVVIIGLVGLATILVLYLADESNRAKQAEELQHEAALERATANYISLCLSCHGPAGEGYTNAQEMPKRTGAALGGVNTSLNQQGVNSAGTPVAGGFDGRTEYIRGVIVNGLKTPDGKIRMPAWSEDLGGSLNDEQIEELVYFVQHADWNHVYNEAIAYYGGYPTPPAPPAAAPTATPPPSNGGGDGTAVTVEMVDIAFTQTEITIAANTDVTINLVNNGMAVHNLHIEGTEFVSKDFNSGESGEMVVNLPPGEYVYFCAVPGHREAGMVGKLIVTEGGGAAGGSSETAAAETPSSGASGTGDSGAATSVDVEMVDIAFTQTELTIAANTDVTFNLVNNGMAVHNLHIEGTEFVSKDFNSGESGEMVVNLPPGEYVYFCAVPGHREAGMVGKLIVTDGAASGGAPAESTGATEGSADAAALPTTVDVEMVDIAFTQTEITIAANTDVTLKLVNNGAAQHNLYIEGTDFKSADFNGGDSGELVVNLPPGEYVYYCAVPGHREAGMVGKLIVK